MERQVIVSIAEDAFLDEKYGAASLLDLLAEPQNVLALLSKNAIHRCVVLHDDLGTEDRRESVCDRKTRCV